MQLLKALVVFMMCLGFSNAVAAEKELNVGFIYVSPIGDAGWSYAHDQARKALATMPGVKTSFVEAVAEGPDSERVMLNMARKGYDIIFAISLIVNNHQSLSFWCSLFIGITR